MTKKLKEYEERRREKEMERERLDRRPGHGAGSYNDELKDADDNSSECRETPNTDFHAKDVDGDGILKSDGTRLSFDELWQKHMNYDTRTTPDDVYDNMRRLERRVDLLRLYTSKLEMSPLQKQRAREWVTESDLSDAGSIGEAELITAAVSLSCNKDMWFVQLEDTFHEILTAMSVKAKSHHAARDYLKEKFNIQLPTGE